MIDDDDDVPYPSPKPTGLMLLPVPGKVTHHINARNSAYTSTGKNDRKRERTISQNIQRY